MKSKFMDTLEDVITSQRTSPVVRKRLLDVLVAVPSNELVSAFSIWPITVLEVMYNISV
jgi:hypothetical protein